MHAHFERPRNKVKNITSKSRKKIKNLPMLSEFRLYTTFWVLILGFQIWFLFFYIHLSFTRQASVSLTLIQWKHHKKGNA